MKSYECDCGCGARTTERNNRVSRKENGAPGGAWVAFSVSFNLTAEEHVQVEADAASFEHVAKATERVIDRAMRGQGRRPPKTVTTTKTLKEIVDEGPALSPLPLSVIPDQMGIDLASVEALSWVKREDGRLLAVTIHFTPEGARA